MEPQENKKTPDEGKEIKVDEALKLTTEDKKMDRKFLIAGILFLILAGLVTGYFLAKEKSSSVISVSTEGGKNVKTGKIFGSTDEKAFPDSAEGTLEKGGIDGEGTHKLIREGGPDKTAYLTSSVLNLDDFVGKKVKVWGETRGAQKAGWLMDVGRVEVK